MLILKLFEIYMILIVYMNTQHIHIEQFHGIGGLADGSNFAVILLIFLILVAVFDDIRQEMNYFQ